MIRASLLLLLGFFVVTTTAQVIEHSRVSERSQWQVIDLQRLRLELPNDFRRIQGPCVHGCNRFASLVHQVVISYGEFISASDTSLDSTELKDEMINVDGLSARKYGYSRAGEHQFFLSIPSDRIGVSIVNLRFYSKDPEIFRLAPKVLATIQIKTRPSGTQRFVSIKPCGKSIVMRPNPWSLKTLSAAIVEVKGKDNRDNWSTLAQQIVERGVDFSLAPDNEASLKSTGADEAILTAIRAVEPRELGEQTRVYESFVDGYASNELRMLKASYESGIEFLNRWPCDPLWGEQASFIRTWLPRLEGKIGFYTLY